MEQKNCPDPRNCSKIHYFGKCPYKHQPCNRGTACSYVKQNNCQFYHPEEDYPQYQTKRASIARKEKRKSIITPLKIVRRTSTTQITSKASKAFAEMAALKQEKPSVQSNSLSKPIQIRENNMIIQPPVRIVQCTPLKATPISSTQKTAEIGVPKYHNEISKNNHTAVALGVPKSKLNEPKIPNYITIIREQEVYIRDLETRIQNAERAVEFNREQALELESSKGKFFTCWSRAVRTLELIRESGAFLDESIAKVIDIHSAALRRHETCSLYAPGLAHLNRSVQKTGYSLKNRVEDQTCFRQKRDPFVQQHGWGRSLGYHHNSVFTHDLGFGFFEDDQDLGENSTIDDSSINFVTEKMLSSLEL